MSDSKYCSLTASTLPAKVKFRLGKYTIVILLGSSHPKTGALVEALSDDGSRNGRNEWHASIIVSIRLVICIKQWRPIRNVITISRVIVHNDDRDIPGRPEKLEGGIVLASYTSVSQTQALLSSNIIYRIDHASW